MLITKIQGKEALLLRLRYRCLIHERSIWSLGMHVISEYHPLVEKSHKCSRAEKHRS